VRENERLDVARHAADTPKSLQQRSPGGRQANVDYGKVAVFFYQVPVDEVLSDPVHASDHVAV
jgi:hypothetical protein